ncbi:MAG: exodeoxyribonuclease VII large subunit [Planctomycetia bacterium]
MDLMSDAWSDPPPDDRQTPPQEVMSVSEVTLHVKEHLESRFSDVWVAGEISNLVRASSGHVYLSLKDDGAVMRGVIWRAARQSLAIEPADGLQVICHGRLDVYPPRGTYQLTIDRLHAIGTGALEARLRKLHESLEREGLFAAARKRPIPAFPRRIAVVTSPTGAAIADFLQTLRSRWRSSEVIIVPSRVQGAGAAEELAEAMATAAKITPRVDVIALIRGGGSLEDLWAFNEEPIVRAVAASPIPVVCGVGHEIDVSLADLAADRRALTPTDAAVQVSPDGPHLAMQLEALARRQQAALLRRIQTAREKISQLARSRIFADPERIMRDRRTMLADQTLRIHRLARAASERAKERLTAAAARLEADSPLKLLARGYSVSWLEDAPIALRSTAGLEPGGRLITQLAAGRIWSRIESVSNDHADREPNP